MVKQSPPSPHRFPGIVYSTFRAIERMTFFSIIMLPTDMKDMSDVLVKCMLCNSFISQKIILMNSP